LETPERASVALAEMVTDVPETTVPFEEGIVIAEVGAVVSILKDSVNFGIS